jgi:hypothetical protein
LVTDTRGSWDVAFKLADFPQTQAASFSSQTSDSPGCAQARSKKFKDQYGDWHSTAEERNENIG